MKVEKVSDSIPIYVRIAEGIKEHILSGDLKEGEQIISTSQLSREYNISIPTVNKGINLLVAEGVVFKKRGIGMFVSEGAVKQLIRARRKTFKQNYIMSLLDEADRLKYTLDELQQIVMEAYKEHGNR